MKDKIFSTITLLQIVCLVSFSQSWQWINTGGGANGVSRGKSVVVSPDGTVFCMGENKNSPIHFGSVNLSCVGEWNTFVCTYSPNGNLINATATSGNTGIGGDIAAWGLKNTDYSSYFINASFAGGAFFDTVYVNMIGNVWAKYNSDARCLKVIPIDWDIQYSGATMYNGDIYAQGAFSQPTVHIDSVTALDTVKGTGFIARLDTNGRCLWVKQAKGLHPEIKCVKNGRIYSSGYSYTTVDYDTLHVVITGDTLSAYIIQLDTGGTIKSCSVIRGAASIATVGADANNNFFASGIIYTTSILGNDTLKLYNNASQDGYLAKFDNNGTCLWAKQFYSNIQSGISSSITDDLGNTYLTGDFYGTIVLGGDTFTSPNMTSMYVVRYDTRGNYMGAKIVSNASGISIAQTASGDVIVTGLVNPGASFDNLPFTTWGQGDFFVAKLGAITGITTITGDDDRLVIYPNPNQKLFTIEVPHSIIQANTALLDIYDNIGNAIQHGTVDISNGKVQVDIGNVQKGIYNVTLSSNKKVFNGRVVVE